MRTRLLFMVVVVCLGMAPRAVSADGGSGGSKLSFENRGEKTVAFTTTLGINPFIVGGLTGAFLLDGFNNAEVSFYSSATNAAGTSRLVANTVALNWRHYFGNSFNMRVGAAQRNLRINYKHEGVDGVKYGGVMAYVSSGGIYTSIGNQWQFGGGFTLGCDWVGFYIPVTQTSDVELKGRTEGLTDVQRTSIIDDAEELNDEVDLLITFLNIGVAF